MGPKKRDEKATGDGDRSPIPAEYLALWPGRRPQIEALYAELTSGFADRVLVVGPKSTGKTAIVR
jgi:MoxR-like ATPase